MSPRRRRGLALALVVVLLLGGAGALVLSAFRQNLVFFFSPSQVQAGEVPQGRAFRLGGFFLRFRLRGGLLRHGLRFGIDTGHFDLGLRFNRGLDLGDFDVTACVDLCLLQHGLPVGFLVGELLL